MTIAHRSQSGCGKVALSRRSRAAAWPPLVAIFTSLAFPALANAQSLASVTWYVTIVLPPKVVAGFPATLAVFGADGRLAPNVTVEIGSGQSVTTDATGRAFFTAPSEPGAIFAQASGVSAVALVDDKSAASPASGDQGLTLAPLISLKDRFSICGGGFRGDADANRVTMNGDRALVVAASPECLVVLPSVRATSGSAKVSVDSSGTQRSAMTTLVSLQFEAPQPAPAPGKKSELTVHVEGSNSPLAIVIQNETPGVVEFLRGDMQELKTSGGGRNIAQVEVSAIRSGDYSFNAKLLASPDLTAAERYIRAAVPLAPKTLRHRVKNCADRLASHPNDQEKVRQELAKMISATIAGNFRTLLEAARAAIS
jgi:hypothetical protein